MADPGFDLRGGRFFSSFFQDIKRSWTRLTLITIFFLILPIVLLATAKNTNTKGTTINKIDIKQTLLTDDASFFTDFRPN